MTHPRTLAATAAAALALTGIAAPALADGPGGNNGNPNNGKKITQAVTLDAVMGHLEQFQAIADANDGNRYTGTSGYEASAQYVEETLREAGYEPERQYFNVDQKADVSVNLRQNSPRNAAAFAYPAAFSPNTPEGGITADLALASENREGCDAAAYGDDVTDKIAVVWESDNCSYGEQSLAAAAVGAEALLVVNSSTLPDTKASLGDPNPDFVPTAMISTVLSGGILNSLDQGETVNVTLRFSLTTIRLETFNILAETSNGRDDNVVVVGAHLDGVEDGPGINDNGSGSAAILETAVQLARVNKHDNQVRFAWWGAEELGLLGSKHYVEDLVANDPAELDKIATYLNFDMVGSPNYIIGVYDADESTYAASATPPEGSIATEAVLTDYFDSVGQPWVDTAYSGRSDYKPFIDNGVPASGLFSGADGRKTEAEVELFGGTAGIIHDPNYHTPADDLSNISEEAMDIMSDAIAFSTLSLAQDTFAVNGRLSVAEEKRAAAQAEAEQRRADAQAEAERRREEAAQKRAEAQERARERREGTG